MKRSMQRSGAGWRRARFGGRALGRLAATALVAAGCAPQVASQVAATPDRSATLGRMADVQDTTAEPVEALRVSFGSHGLTLVGNLHFRPTRKPNALPPVIIVTGALTTVKEQMPSAYAPILAEAGFAALVFDFRGWGESEGLPRDVESPVLKAQDIQAAVAFLQTNGGVDGRRVGVLAISSSAGYAALAARSEPGIKSIAMVAPWLHNQEIVRALYGGETGVRARLEQGRVARQIYSESGVVSYVHAASTTDPSAAMYGDEAALDYFLDPKRGAIPQWRARFAVMSWPEVLQFDPIPIADTLDVPTRIITGPQTATPEGARAFAARLKGPHDVVELEGIQSDFYDRPRTVSSAAAAAIAHFRRTL
jgi:pimeloyl-ACP methyl ester carboxylesterase